MLEFIKDNWANILLIIVGSFALATYILQERKKKIDAASLIVLQIDEFQERLREISTFIVDGQLNETAFYESLPLMDTDYWNKYKHYFVRKMDATSYTALNQLYEYVSEIQEQQMLMKAFQKNSFQITQNVLANIESQFIVADLNNACTGVTAQNITSAMGNMIPQGVSEADRNTLNAMVQQIAAQNPNFDMNRFWSLYNQQRIWTKSIINQGALTSYTPVQIRISLEKMLKKCRKNFYRRQLAGDIFLVEPNDCIMVIEVKGNATLDDLTETIEKNKFFQLHDETKHIKLAMFAFKTRIGKQRLYKEFGYKYDRSTKGYIQERLPEEKTLDYFVCLHRESLTSSARDKQVFFLKDGQDRQFYVLDNHFPIMQNFSRLIQSLQN